MNNVTKNERIIIRIIPYLQICVLNVTKKRSAKSNMGEKQRTKSELQHEVGSTRRPCIEVGPTKQE